MGGYSFDEDCDFILPPTLVLVGKTGNGKSATGNSIIGMQMFQSKRSSSAVTTTSELKTTTMEDGQTLNVIDTPGLFDSSLDIEFVEKEIYSCIDMVSNGVDAFLVVMSIRSRFSDDEKAAISRLINLFGRKIYNYMIIVFTGGDELEDDDKSFGDFLCDSPKALQEILRLCGNRCVVFDNKTKDPSKRSNQVQKLLSLVKMVSKNNGGKPYTNEIFTEPKNCAWALDEQQISMFNERMEMVESKLKETTLRHEQVLAEEQNARLKDVENARNAQKKLDKKLQKKWTNERLVCDKQIKQMFEMASYFIGREVESKLKETSLKLEQQLVEERTARLMAEENAKAAQMKSNLEIQKVESKLKEESLKLEQLLAKERIARLKAEEDAKIAQKKSDDEILKVELKLKETTLNLQHLVAEERTARLKTKKNAKLAEKKSDKKMIKVKSKLKETTLKLQQLLAESLASWLMTEENAKAAQKKFDNEIQTVESKFKETTSKLEQLLLEEQGARLMTYETVEGAQKISSNEILKVESKLKETSLKLEQLLAKERIARLKAQENAKIAQKKSADKIQKVKSKLKETTLKLQQLLAESLASWLMTEENAKAAQKKSDKEIQTYLRRTATEKHHENNFRKVIQMYVV